MIETTGNTEFIRALESVAYTAPAHTAQEFGVTFVANCLPSRTEPVGHGQTMRDAIVDLLGKLGAV